MDRDGRIARSVALAITSRAKKQPRSTLASIFALLSAVFSFFELPLNKVSAESFARLRREHWKLIDGDYAGSFTSGDGRPEDALHSIGDMGFSGSTFYVTQDGRFLIKSVPRPSEYSFFRDDLLQAYIAHMAAHPKSLLVRICDFLGSPWYSLGAFLGAAPSHHIVMDNVMYGQDDAKKQGRPKWQHWDLKPMSYFYPERDIASGMLATEETLDKLADEFKDRMVLSRAQADELFAGLEEDTRLLAAHNAVDYSLFLVRIEASNPEAGTEATEESPARAKLAENVPTAPPSVPPTPPSWRTGIPSSDGKHIFRAAVLDFFWAKHKVQPRLMTMLISLWNLVTRQGHMSITTTPEEYRERFLKMCRAIVEIKEEEEVGEASGDASGVS